MPTDQDVKDGLTNGTWEFDTLLVEENESLSYSDGPRFTYSYKNKTTKEQYTTSTRLH
jgi:hypothetical protein